MLNVRNSYSKANHDATFTRIKIEGMRLKIYNECCILNESVYENNLIKGIRMIWFR